MKQGIKITVILMSVLCLFWAHESLASVSTQSCAALLQNNLPTNWMEIDGEKAIFPDDYSLILIGIRGSVVAMEISVTGDTLNTIAFLLQEDEAGKLCEGTYTLQSVQCIGTFKEKKFYVAEHHHVEVVVTREESTYTITFSGHIQYEDRVVPLRGHLKKNVANQFHDFFYNLIRGATRAEESES